MISKDWYAWINNLPAALPSFHLIGGVEVANPGIEVVVTKRSPTGHNSSILTLDLSLHQKPGMWPQVLSCASANYDEVISSPHTYTSVQIFDGTAMITRIDPIDIVT